MTINSLVLRSGIFSISLIVLSQPAFGATCPATRAINSTHCIGLTEPLPAKPHSPAPNQLAKAPNPLLSLTSLQLAAQPPPESPLAEASGAMVEPEHRSVKLLPSAAQAALISSQAADLSPVTGSETRLLELDRLVSAPEPAVVAQDSPDEPAESIWERSQLTGDWGGVRSQLAESGITFDLYFTQFLQGAAITSGSHEFNYGGRFDALINFDTEKLGLWDGGSFNTHLELRYGNIPQFPSEQGALWPVNTGTAVPLGDSGNLVASSLYLSQRLGDVSLLIGKINVLDLLASNPFFGGWGTQRFMNVSFVAPPSGVLPPTIFGAIANVNLNPVTLTFQVFDPNDQSGNYWSNNLFADGVNFSAGATYATTISSRPTTFNLTGTYSTKTGADLNDFLLPADVQGGTRQGSFNIAFQFTHLLHQLPDNPREGWGIYFKGAIADGNPNIIQDSVITGIGGKGLFTNRPNDRFGLGFFYWNFSDDLQNAVSPVTDFGNEYGLEAYYSYAVTPWFHLTGDVQYVSPANQDFSDALFLGLRAGIRF